MSAFRCPACGGATAVLRSEPVGKMVQRYRGCRDCPARFKTAERLLYQYPGRSRLRDGRRLTQLLREKEETG